MNMKQTKIALALGGLLFLSAPLSSAFADEKHNENKEMQMGNTMQYIKNELRGYVEGVKGDDAQMMQQHLDQLLKLSAMSAMDHSNMDHADMASDAMPAMDHADMASDAMPAMDHANMDHAGMASDAMPAMDHTNMDHSEMEADHANMDGVEHDMSAMANMEGMSPTQHQHIMYMQGITGLNDLFKQLGKTQDKAEIKLILRKIKAQIKNNQQLFS